MVKFHEPGQIRKLCAEKDCKLSWNCSIQIFQIAHSEEEKKKSPVLRETHDMAERTQHLLFSLQMVMFTKHSGCFAFGIYEIQHKYTRLQFSSEQDHL